MRILAFESTPTTLLGGSERSYFDVLTGLRSRGHDVELYYTSEGNLVDKYREAGVSTTRLHFSYIIHPGHRLSDMTSMMRSLLIVRKAWHGDRCVVYLNFAEALPFAILLKVFCGFAVVCHIRIGFFGLSRQIRLAGRFADRFIVINRRFRDTFAQVFKKKDEVNVVYNGLTIPDTLPAPVIRGTSDLKLLYFGRVAPEKGVIELVRAASTAIRSGVRLELQITGDFVMSHSGDYRAELADAIDQAAMGPHTTFSGAVVDPLSYMRKFELFVMPSTWEEPFGRTVPEAILAGVPVLARSVGMMEEIMADNPHFLFNTDEELTDKIIAFSRGNLSFDFDAARTRITRDFNKDRMIAQVESILTTVVEQ
jgi:glycosyltransferase involved in cell wall biosynthesis